MYKIYRKGEIFLDNNSVCFLDTEFNATDYAEQNDGVQEITEIGAVIFRNGKPAERFLRCCLIKKGHILTDRCMKITGMTPGKMKRKGIPFIQAMKELGEFLDKNNIEKVYTFGSADAFEMRTTAKLNNAGHDILQTIKKMKNIYPVFEQRLELKYAFSLIDICRICYVNHDAEGRAHSAINDAEDTGLAFYNMKAKKINKKLLKEINKHKDNVKIYRANRSVKQVNIKPVYVVTDKFIRNLEYTFQNAATAIDGPVLAALHDDVMRMIGRPDLETGENNL